MTSDPDRPLAANSPLHGEPAPQPLAELSGVPAEPAHRQESAVHFTRAAALWSALIVGFLILILLLVFILQNTDSATVHFFAWQWNLPIGVGILLAAVSGGLLTVAAGSARIVQLRRAAKRNLKGGL